MASGQTTPASAPQRLGSLDLVRGIAVLGILAINVAGFAGPTSGITSPCWLAGPAPCETTAYAISFVLFEGKMRALFAMLFGAGIALFDANARQRGRADADRLQVRRLLWLMVLGSAHYFALWWGDILFVYGCSGMLVLVLNRVPDEQIATLAVLVALFGFVWTIASDLPAVEAEELVRTGRASAAQTELVHGWHDWLRQRDQSELTLYQSGFPAIALSKLREQPLWLVSMTLSSFTEIVPLMLGGLLLYRSGLFSGGWSRRRLFRVGLLCLMSGLFLTLGALAWLWPRHFPFIAMAMLLGDGLLPAHVLMGTGYILLIVAAAARLAPTLPGRCLVAAGRMAFSNYIASSLVMTALFYGWGLGLFASEGPTRQWLYVIAVWTAMLVWSPMWLAHFRRGPLEWLWRSLVEWRLLPNRR